MTADTVGRLVYSLLVSAFAADCLSAAGSPTEHLSGTRPATAQERAVFQEVLVPLPRSRTRSPSTSVKNYRHLPAVRSQQLNNCAAFAPTYYYRTYQEARERGWVRPDPDTHPQRVLSPGFTYPLANGGENDAASLEFVLWILCRFGAATWQDMPENPQDWWSYPTEQQWRQAIPFRAGNVLQFDTRTDAGIDSMKAHLASGDPLLLQIRIYHDTHDSYPDGTGVDNDVIYSRGSQIWDNHVFTVIGFDDAKPYHDGVTARTGAFLAVNSWGPNWGVVDPDVGTGGFVWFGYDYIKSGTLSESVAYALTDRLDYKPRTLAVMDLQHPRRNELTVGLYEGGSSNVMTSFPNAGAVPFEGRVVVDVTDTDAEAPYAFWLTASDVPGAPADTGWINHFEIEWEDGRSSTSGDTPLQTVDWSPTSRSVRVYAGIVEPSEMTFDADHGTEPGHHDFDSFAGGWCDWDLDGLPDLLIGANRLSYAPDFTTLYPNRSGTLTRQTVDPPLPAINLGHASWTDYDLDGRPDFCINGYNTNLVKFCDIYRSDGLHGFTNVLTGLPGLSHGAAAWGDYDNDGDPDVALCGISEGGTVVQVWRNDGNAGFTESGIAFPDAERGAIAWADVNNDGWLDLSIANKIFRNNGNETFSDWRVTIPGRMDGAHAWGDYDGDGDVDLAACELNTDTFPATYVMRLYRNNGEQYVSSYGGFWVLLLAPVSGNWVGLSDASLTWADFDNDGRLDLAACGMSGQDAEMNIERRTLIYRQESSGSFRDAGFNVPGLGQGILAWADVEDDGDLDLLAAGGESSIDNRSSARLYTSLVGDGSALNRPNARPGSPGNLNVNTWSNSMLRFTWDAATDTETPSAALSYEMRVGTLPGGCDIVSPVTVPAVVGSQGHRRVQAGVPGALLRLTTAGRYYWSVRSVDGGLSRSAWSAEQAFTLGTGGLLTGDVNGDGQLDVADLIRCRKMARGDVPPNPGLADLTGDGRVDDCDTRALATMLLPAGGASTYLPITEALCGGGGGSLAAEGFELSVPAGALNEPARLRLLASSDDRPFGAVSPATMYRVEGLPAAFAQPLTIRLPALRTNAGVRVHLAVGEPSVGTGTGPEDQWGYMFLEATTGADGVPTFSLPATAASSRRGMAPVGSLSSPSPVTWEWTFGGFFSDSVLVVQSQHFKISYPVEWVYRQPYIGKLSKLVTDLEWAFEKLPQAGFVFAHRRTWPAQVTILDDRSPLADIGGARQSMLGDNYGYLEFNERILNDPAVQKTTACHEFSHLVQGLFDPRNSWSKAKFASDHYWFDEAMATWFEKYGTDTPQAYMSVNYQAYRNDAYEGGMLCPTIGLTKSRKQVARHGYGMAALADFLATDVNSTIFGTIYEKIAEGKDVLTAIATATEDSDGDRWCHGMYTDWILGELYPEDAIALTGIIPKSRIFTIKSVAQRLVEYNPVMPGIGTQIYAVRIDPRCGGLTGQDVLAFSLRGNGYQKLGIMTARREADRKMAANLITVAGLPPQSARCFLPEISSFAAAGRSAYAVITSNDRNTPCQLPDGALRLRIGLARPLDGSRTLPAYEATACNVMINSRGIRFPRYACTGAVSTGPQYGSYTSSVFNAGDTIQNSTDIRLWTDEDIALPVSFNAVLSSSTFETNLLSGSRRVYTVTANRGLRVTKQVSPTWLVTRRTDISGPFTADLAADEDGAVFTVYIMYEMKEEEYSRGGTLLDQRTYPQLLFPVMHLAVWRL